MNSSILLLVAIALGVAVAQESPQTNDSAELIEWRQSCIDDQKVQIENYQESLEGDFIDDSELKPDMFCVNKLANVQDNEGKIVEDGYRNYLKQHRHIQDDSVIDKLVQVCGKIDKGTGEQTAFELAICEFGILGTQ